jgi:hypothetical protein
MLSSVYKRSKARVDACLKKAGTTFIAMEPLRIHIPERFAERGLAVIEDVSYILGCLAIITEDNYYAPSTVTAMLKTEPDRVGRIVIDDVGYIELSYNKGSKVIASTEPVVVDNLPHRIYTELLGKGRIPWYYDYTDIPFIFRESLKYNGVRLGADLAIWEYIAAQLCRDPDNPTRYWRQVPNAKALLATKSPYFVALRNVSIGSTNMTARLGGSYFDPGMTSTLANPSDRNERFETVLRR